MRDRIKRPSPAFVLAFIALLIALGGTAFALKNHTVGASKLKQYVKRENTKTASSSSILVSQRCKSKERFISGTPGTGVSTLLSDLEVKGAYFLFKSGKPNKVDGMVVRYHNQGGGSQTAGVGIICLKK